MPSQDAADDEGQPMRLADALAMAVAWHQEGRYAEAASIYRQILAEVPDHVDALHFLGVAEHQAGRPALALDCLNRVLALVPDHPDALSNRGNLHRTMGRLAEAEADYRRALGLRPQDPATLSNLGTVLRGRGDREGAVAMFQAAVAAKPDLASAWQNLGGTLESLHRGAEAIAAYQQAARFSPESPAAFRNLGIALSRAGRVEEAIEMYRRCLALAPGDARARHLLVASTGEAVPARAPDEYVRAEFDHFASGFDAKLAELGYRGPAIVAEAVAALAGDLRPAPTVLDAGCGTGLCAPLLRPHAARLVGVDLSPGMVAKARERGGYDELAIAELTGFLRQRPQAFDLVVSADTLVYFGDLSQVIPAARAALRPRGALVFTLERCEAGEAPAGFHLHPHGRYSHTRDYVMRILQAAGFVDLALSEISSRREVESPVPGWLGRGRVPAAT
jgi:predicted TPR repeat methyltransferase